MIDQIRWLGHSSFFIQGPPLIYINPRRIVRSTFHADVILIGTADEEHCSPADIQKLRGDKTRILGNAAVANEVEGCEILRPWQSTQVDRAGIKAIPAYSPRSLQNPQDKGGLGFVISLNYYDIYYTGETQQIPEMERIVPDIVLLPIDGSGTLTVMEAVEVVKLIRPRWVIPYNWEPGQEAEARRFKREVGDRSTVILPAIAE